MWALEVGSRDQIMEIFTPVFLLTAGLGLLEDSSRNRLNRGRNR